MIKYRTLEAPDSNRHKSMEMSKKSISIGIKGSVLRNTPKKPPSLSISLKQLPEVDFKPCVIAKLDSPQPSVIPSKKVEPSTSPNQKALVRPDHPTPPDSIQRNENDLLSLGEFLQGINKSQLDSDLPSVCSKTSSALKKESKGNSQRKKDLFMSQQRKYSINKSSSPSKQTTYDDPEVDFVSEASINFLSLDNKNNPTTGTLQVHS